MSTTPQIFAISISSTKGTRKQNVPDAQFREDFGIVGDAHAGPGPRQVSLLSWEEIKNAGANKTVLHPGDFAENITTQGMDLSQLDPGDKIMIAGQVVLEITQIGKTCHGRCEVAKRIGDCIMPRQGVFARVLKGGPVKVADPVRVNAGSVVPQNCDP